LGLNGSINVRNKQMAEAEQHTPGPWKVFEDWGVDHRTVIGPGGEDIIETDNGGCASDPSPDYISLSKGNARLIAASPEMLEALKGLVQDMGKEPGDCLVIFNDDDRYLSAVAAIQKAQPSQPRNEGSGE
jgi:hypothetical protein